MKLCVSAIELHTSLFCSPPLSLTLVNSSADSPPCPTCAVQWLPENEHGSNFTERGHCRLAAPPHVFSWHRRPRGHFFFNYSEDDDSFLAAVSRGWNKHFPEITRKRERTPNWGGWGAGIESRPAVRAQQRNRRGQSSEAEGLTWFCPSISTVTCPEMLLALAWATGLGQ